MNKSVINLANQVSRPRTIESLTAENNRLLAALRKIEMLTRCQDQSYFVCCAAQNIVQKALRKSAGGEKTDWIKTEYLAWDEEAKQRQARMLAAGHQIPSDDEAQATLDATIHSMERDTENE